MPIISAPGRHRVSIQSAENKLDSYAGTIKSVAMLYRAVGTGTEYISLRSKSHISIPSPENATSTVLSRP
jgi:hypothetical protein